MSKKIVCDYLEFVNQIKEITEDSLFVIQGKHENIEDIFVNLNVPDERIEEYENSGFDVFAEIVLLLSGVKDGIKVELDLRNFNLPEVQPFSFNCIKTLKGIILPKTCSMLCIESFSCCENLEWIIIPDTSCPLEIFKKALYNCRNLKQFRIEGEVGTVNYDAICECPNLQTVEFPYKSKDINYYHLNPSEFTYETIRIETDRLILRPLLLKDFEAMKKIFTDPRMLEYEEKKYSTEEHLKEELEQSEKCWNIPNLTFCHFAVCLKENEEIIGHIPLVFSEAYVNEENFEDQTGHSIGWAIAYEYQKKGYATEAAKEIIKWAKGFLKLKRIWAYADKDNKASIHVMEKLGMSLEKEYKCIRNDDMEGFQVIYAVEINIKDTIKKLKTNAAFQMSLSGKELFHSNMIAMFMTQEEYPELTNTMIELFPPTTGKNPSELVVFDVLREKQNIDLIICYCGKKEKQKLNANGYFCVDDIPEPIGSKKGEDSNSEENSNSDEKLPSEIGEILEQMQYVIIENKFKSFPYDEQLEKYSEKNFSVFPNWKKDDGKTKYDFEISASKKNITCYLLAPVGSLKAFWNNTSFEKTYGEKNKVTWKGRTYEEYKNSLHKIKFEDNNEKLMPLFIKKYIAFLDTMISLYAKSVEGRLTDEKCFLSEEDNKYLLKGRIQDFYEKIIYSRLLAKIKNDLPKLQNKKIRISEDGKVNEISENKEKPYDINKPFFYSDSGYSRQTGMLDFRYVWPDSMVSSGIEIQGNSFRIVFCHEIDAFKKIFGISKWNKTQYIAFKNKLEKNAILKLNDSDPGKSFNSDSEAEITRKCIDDIYMQIKEKMNIVIPERHFKKNKNKLESVYSYSVRDNYTFRYAHCDLNDFFPKTGNKKTDIQLYRELEYKKLKEFIEVACDIIGNPDNQYEKIRKKYVNRQSK